MQDNLTGRLARWFEFFQEYLITEIKHVKGVENVVADALSRRPDYAQVYGVFSIAPLVASVTMFSSMTFQEILEDQLKDPLCQKLLMDLRGDHLGPLDPIRNQYKVTDNGVLMWKSQGRELVLVPPRHRHLLLTEAHNTAFAAHQGVDKTYGALAEAYYWPSMHKDVV